MNIYGVYETIKNKIYEVVKPYIKENGGYIVPVEENAEIVLRLYGTDTIHKVQEMYLTEDEKDIVVITYCDGKREADLFEEFSLEEMVRILGVFNIHWHDNCNSKGKTKNGNTMELNKKYFYEAAKENEVTLKEYLDCVEFNYVIIDGDGPLMWSNGCPVIYGDKADAKSEISQMSGDVTEVSIITEKAFLGRYCLDEYVEAIKKVAEDDGKTPMQKAYELYTKMGGTATIEQMERAMDYVGLCAEDYDETKADSLMAEVTDAFAVMFIEHNKGFEKWFKNLSENDRFDVYGEIIAIEPAKILALIDDDDEKGYTTKTYELMGGDIMYIGNGHSTELVEKINDAWRKHKQSFEIILKALYERDIDEITDSDAFQIAKWVGSWQWNEGCRNDNWTPYMDMALADMKEHWEDYAENYLMHIADDADLEAIIAFMHYPYLPIWK